MRAREDETRKNLRFETGPIVCFQWVRTQELAARPISPFVELVAPQGPMI
jgi:hypothetical protein